MLVKNTSHSEIGLQSHSKLIFVIQVGSVTFTIGGSNSRVANTVMK